MFALFEVAFNTEAESYTIMQFEKNLLVVYSKTRKIAISSAINIVEKLLHLNITHIFNFEQY